MDVNGKNLLADGYPPVQSIRQFRYSIPGSPVEIAIIRSSPTLSLYQIIEPGLSPEMKEILTTIRRRISMLFKDKSASKRFKSDFSAEFFRIMEGWYPFLSDEEIHVFEYYINRDSRGLAALQPMIDDPVVSCISINGPGNSITVQHEEHGYLLSSLTPDEDELRTYVRKICNRSKTLVDKANLPPVFHLKSGITVHISGLEESGNLQVITLKKPGSSEEYHQSDDLEITSYQLYHDMIRVRLVISNDNNTIYHLSLSPLTLTEEHAVRGAKEADVKIAGLKTPGGRAVRLSTEEFTQFIAKNYPKIPKNRYHFLYVALTFTLDPVRWIRLLVSDHQVLRIRCSHPDTPVEIWHEMAEQAVKTTLVPTRSDLNRFADFLIKSSGKEIDPDNLEILLRFKSGEKATLTRVMDDAGHYFRIDLNKKNSGAQGIPPQNDEGDTQGKISPVSRAPTHESDPRIGDLLIKIFENDTSEPQEGALLHSDAAVPVVDSSGISNRIIQSAKNCVRSFSIFGLGRESGKPSHDPPPVPDTLQVPSVLSVQGKEGMVAEEAYWLYQPHAYAVIVQDKNKDRSYQIVEPELSSRERIILEETHETLRDVLVYDQPVARGDLFLEYGEVARVVKTYDPKITDDRLSVLYYYLRRNLNGYGKIDGLMYDELLEDISCNGHNLPVYIHHRYYGSIPTSIRFETEELNRFVLKLSQKADKQVSLTSPLLDASLPNGSRAQITYSDVVSTKGSSFTIRKFRSDPMTPATLMAFGTYSDELLAFIWLALENRQSLIVVGGTASGKTSAMNAFSFFIPHNSKIVSLEDTREIQIPQKNWLPVQTRASNTVNDRGSVDLFDLLKASLRQRPEYIIVGEVRGSEAQTLFQAMNSGHTTLSTLHAGNIEEALNRLTNEPINVPPAMFAALNLMVIQTFHYRGGRMIRRCDAIHEIVLGEGDKVRWNTLFEYDPTNDSFKRVYKKSKTLQTIQYMHNWNDEEIRYHLDLRAGFLAKLRNQYSTDPEVLIRMITDLRRLA